MRGDGARQIYGDPRDRKSETEPLQMPRGPSSDTPNVATFSNSEPLSEPKNGSDQPDVPSMSDDELKEEHDFQKTALNSREEDQTMDSKLPPDLPQQARMKDRMEEPENEMKRRKLDDYAHISDSISTIMPPLAATDVPGSSYVRPDGGSYQRPDGGTYLRPSESVPEPASLPALSSVGGAQSEKVPEGSSEVLLSERPLKELLEDDLGPMPDTIQGVERRIADLKMIFEGRDTDFLGPWAEEDRKLLRDYFFEAERMLTSLKEETPEMDFTPNATMGVTENAGVHGMNDNELAAQALWTLVEHRKAKADDLAGLNDGAAFLTLADLVNETRKLLNAYPAAPEFASVSNELLGFLAPKQALWADKMRTSKGGLTEADQQRLRNDVNFCRTRLHGIQKALGEMRQGRLHDSGWVMPDQFEAEELRKEAGVPVFDAEMTNEVRRLDEQSRKVGGKFIASRQASESELCLNIDIYAEALSQTFKSAAEENDFVFALYGPWGRGKSTLISKAAKLLSKGESQKADAPYEPVFFSAWKYPTRPEVWVHLYQRLAAAAQAGGWLQKTRISLRMGLVRNGWWPLILGFALLAISRLQLDFTHWLFDGVGILGVLILGSFVWNAVKAGKQFAYAYFAMPNHGEKLGLQAVIGEDFKHLLEVWTRPNSTETATPATCDFSRCWPARSAMTSVVVLIWVTLGLVSWKIHHHLPNSQGKESIQSAPIISISKDGKTSAEPVSAATPPPIRIEVDAEWQGAKLRWAGTSSPKNGESPAAQPKSQGSVLFLDWLFGLIGIASPVFAVLVSMRPRQCKRVLLVVDDLDRCEPEQMLSVIESLRLFLDEPEMSRRLQVAMLLDRGILKSAMLNRANVQKLRLESELSADFFRQQEEKLFVVSMSLPPIDGGMLNTLAKNLVQREVLQQAATREDRSLPTELVTSTPSAHSNREAVSDAQDSQLPVSKASEIKSRVIEPEDTQRNSILMEVQFSPEEQSLLVDALADFEVSNITPRSYRAFVLRYQLVRLILQGFKTVYQPRDVIIEIGRRLFISKTERPSSGLSPEVLTAIDSVVVDDR